MFPDIVRAEGPAQNNPGQASPAIAAALGIEAESDRSNCHHRGIARQRTAKGISLTTKPGQPRSDYWRSFAFIRGSTPL